MRYLGDDKISASPKLYLFQWDSCNLAREGSNKSWRPWSAQLGTWGRGPRNRWAHHAAHPVRSVLFRDTRTYARFKIFQRKKWRWNSPFLTILNGSLPFPASQLPNFQPFFLLPASTARSKAWTMGVLPSCWTNVASPSREVLADRDGVWTKGWSNN